MPSFKPPFSDPVLFGMVRGTQAHRPTVRRLQPDSAVGASANMRTFNRNGETAGDATVMAADPRPVAWALALGGGGRACLFEPSGQAHDLRIHQDEVCLPVIANDRLVAPNIGLAHLLGRTCRSEKHLPLPGKAFTQRIV